MRTFIIALVTFLFMIVASIVSFFLLSTIHKRKVKPDFLNIPQPASFNTLNRTHTMKIIKVKFKLFSWHIAIYLYKKTLLLTDRIKQLTASLYELQESSNITVKEWMDNYEEMRDKYEREYDFNKNSRIRRRNNLRRKSQQFKRLTKKTINRICYPPYETKK